MKTFGLLLCISLTLFAARLNAEPQPVTHELVPRYEGSEMQSNKVEEFGEYKLITSASNKGELAGQTLNGKIIRLLYANPAKRSTLEIFSNYESSLRAAGMQPMFSCALKECGPAFALSAWGRFNGLFVASDGDPRYLSGKITEGTTEKYVALLVGRNRTQIDIIEMKPMQKDMVVNADILAQGIDRDGKVSVYGIYFDNDKSIIKAESKPSIEEIAKLLRSRPDLDVFIVGHTDMVGNVGHNQDLSEARARAVVTALVNQHGIKAERLDGRGVGPLSPVGPNTSETGRAKNRRVELVVRSTKG